jgi:predicted O-methyltransferase YrrM
VTPPASTDHIGDRSVGQGIIDAPDESFGDEAGAAAGEAVTAQGRDRVRGGAGRWRLTRSPGSSDDPLCGAATLDRTRAMRRWALLVRQGEFAEECRDSNNAMVTDGGSSVPEVRLLLASLVAAKPAGRIAEIGTAFGEGTRAMVDALGPTATLVSVEPERERLDGARRALAGARVELIHGRWQDVLPDRAPFDLIFFDGGVDEPGLRAAIDLLAPGGILVKDDMTPGRAVMGDPVREILLLDERVRGVEILMTLQTAAIIAVRRA